MRLVLQETASFQCVPSCIGDVLEAVSVQHDSSVPSTNDDHHILDILYSVSYGGRYYHNIEEMC